MGAGRLSQTVLTQPGEVEPGMEAAWVGQLGKVLRRRW